MEKSQRKSMVKLSGINMRFYILLTTIFAVIVMWQLPNSQTSGTSMKPEIDGGIISTLRIVVALCFSPGDHNDKIARRFIGCYDHVPGKELFFKCQKKLYGVLLDSKAHIDVACDNSQRLPQYAMCIQRAFRKAKISMPIAVTMVNVCQGKVLRL